MASRPLLTLLLAITLEDVPTPRISAESKKFETIVSIRDGEPRNPLVDSTLLLFCVSLPLW